MKQDLISSVTQMASFSQLKKKPEHATDQRVKRVFKDGVGGKDLNVVSEKGPWRERECRRTA